MSNDRNDFLPEVRNSALWSGDARRYATGKAGEVYAEKIGAKALDDLSHVELVQMGHVFQEPIMREYARRKQINFKDADYALSHPNEPYIRSHFDYISEDGATLYEVKNLGVQQRKKYGDEGSDQIDLGYRVQCLHEAVVHRIEKVVLVVCFGGQEIVGYPVEFSADQMDMHVKEMAKFWGRIQARNFDPESMGDAARLVYKQDSGQNLVATHTLEEQVKVLKLIKDQIKDLEDKEEKLSGAIQGYMMEAAQLMAVDGSVLATWKTSKSSKRFSADLFKQSMPEMYEKFVVEQPGSRRFLVK
jgi:predicted phage-related endonuclease